MEKCNYKVTLAKEVYKMLYYENILFSLYEIKEYAELMNKYVKDENISSNNVQNFTSRIIEHAKVAIGEVKSRMTVEDLSIKKAFEEVQRRENTGEEEEET
jgi:hypothetical protein